MAAPAPIDAPEGYDPATKAKQNDTSLSASDRERLKEGLGLDKGDVGAHVGIKTLDAATRKIVINNASLGIGYDLSTDIPQLRGRQVIQLPNSNAIHIRNENSSNIETTISYTARASSYAKSGWAKAAASVSTPWVSASVEASHTASQASSSSSKTIFITGKYYFSRGSITLQPNPQPHPDFQAAVENALSKPEVDRTEALDNVFQRWGHVYASSVKLGGMKVTETMETNVSSSDERTKESEVKTAVNASFGNKGGSASAGTGQSEARGSREVQTQEKLSFDTVGGNTLTQDINEWRKSLVNPKLWNVISVLQVESTIKLFDQETRNKIIAAQPRLGKLVYQLNGVLGYGSTSTQEKDRSERISTLDTVFTSMLQPLPKPLMSNNFTITAWFRINTQQGSKRDKDHTVFSCGDMTKITPEPIITVCATDSYVKFFIMQDSPTVRFTAKAYMINRWSHVAVVQDSTKKSMHFYLDGVKQDRNEELWDGYFTAVGNLQEPTLSIGPQKNPIHTEWKAGGQISGVSVFDFALDHIMVLEMFETTEPSESGTRPFVYTSSA